MPKPKYPNVRCEAHPEQVIPGYVVCTHVLDDHERPTQIELANPRRLGEILCARTDHDLDDLKTICAFCASELAVSLKIH